MRILKNATRLNDFALILSLALVFTTWGCKKKQSPQAQNEAQNGLVKSATQSQAYQETSNEKISLRILYVGLPNTQRQEDFVSFLSKNFVEVKTVDLYIFKEEQTKDSDVVILDKDGIQWGNEGGRPLADFQMSPQYSRPTLSLGIPGAFWADRRRLKTGYM